VTIKYSVSAQNDVVGLIGKHYKFLVSEEALVYAAFAPHVTMFTLLG